MTEATSRPLYNGKTTGRNDAGVAPVGRQPQGPPNGCQHTQHRSCGALYPQPKPVPIILLGEQRHMCVNNLPRVAPSGGTAGNRTRNLESDALLLHHQATHTEIDGCTDSVRQADTDAHRQTDAGALNLQDLKMTDRIRSKTGKCRTWKTAGHGR